MFKAIRLKAVCILLAIGLFGCAPLLPPLTQEEKNNADYGYEPTELEISEKVNEFCSRVKANDRRIRNCDMKEHFEPYKAVIRYVLDDKDRKYEFGYVVDCTLALNRQGVPLEFLFRNGFILYFRLPNTFWYPANERYFYAIAN